MDETTFIPNLLDFGNFGDVQKVDPTIQPTSQPSSALDVSVGGVVDWSKTSLNKLLDIYTTAELNKINASVNAVSATATPAATVNTTGMQGWMMIGLAMLGVFLAIRLVKG